uniref:Uncharacterized protein n=1 Tax=Oryza glumipatula TaxID=40148 RepID=A0A0E0BN23_9ORYZ
MTPTTVPAPQHGRRRQPHRNRAASAPRHARARSQPCLHPNPASATPSSPRHGLRAPASCRPAAVLFSRAHCPSPLRRHAASLQLHLLVVLCRTLRLLPRHRRRGHPRCAAARRQGPETGAKRRGGISGFRAAEDLSTKLNKVKGRDNTRLQLNQSKGHIYSFGLDVSCVAQIEKSPYLSRKGGPRNPDTNTVLSQRHGLVDGIDYFFILELNGPVDDPYTELGKNIMELILKRELLPGEDGLDGWINFEKK